MIKTFFLLLSVGIGFISARNSYPISETGKLTIKNTNSAINKDTTWKKNKIMLNGAAIEKNAKLINLKFDKSNEIIKLNSTELIEDDAPASGQPEGYDSCCGRVAWIEDLSKGIVIKKIWNVENPSAISARVVFSGMEVVGNTSSLHLSLNGEEFVRPASKFAFPNAHQYFDPTLNWDHWYFINLPAKKLRKGNNELLMWAESNSISWRILIADEKEFKRGSLNRTSPNRSMKSSDGGKTWSDSRLGAMNAIDGEYSIRLSLDHYPPSGEYMSPLMDVVSGDNPFKINSHNVKVSFGTEFQEPAQTSIKAFVRFGASPFIGDNSWSDWQVLENGKEYTLADKKYLQWRAGLATNDLLVTPLIKSVSITSSWEDNSPNHNTGLSVHVVNNGEIINPSYQFSYENLNHPELKKFREDHQLDEVVAGTSSEFETVLKLLNWAYRASLTFNAYSWNWNDAAVHPNNGGQNLNQDSKQNQKMSKLNGPFYSQRRRNGMCLYSTQALIGALLSMGYQARHVNINSEAMSGHEITEVWSNDFNKWIYLDPTIDSYYFDIKTGVPLNVLEIHNLLVEKMPRVETWEHPFVTDIGKEVVSKIKIGMRQGNNPFSIINSTGDSGGSWALETMGRFRIILRNDFLSHPIPVPVHTGATSWGWNGFLNWYDHTFPKRDEYQNYSDRATDFYQPLNQAKVFLTETNEPGVLEVNIENFTPGGFDGFLVATNYGEWISQKDPSWNWSLRPGSNTIKVRTKNVRGVLGPVSEIEVNYNP